MANKRLPRTKQGSAGTLRIIGGQWRGRKLHFPPLEGLRPTGDRVRETLFNWISPYVVDAHCLDLFAGSGALGLEAVSRGAASATLIEMSARACNALREHVSTLCAGSRVNVYRADARHWLSRSPSKPFDLVFLDPPFATGLLADTLPLLEAGGWLSHDALIYVESDREQTIALPPSWQPMRILDAGQVRCQLLRSDNVRATNQGSLTSADR